MSYLLVGRWAFSASEAKEGLEGGHGRPAPVMAEHELIEVDLQLCTADSVVGSHEPILKVADRPVSKRDDGLDTFSQAERGRLGSRDVLVPGLHQSPETLEAIGVDGGTGFDVPCGELPDRCRAEVGNDFHSNSPGGTPAPLDGHENQRSLASLELAAAAEPCLGSTHPRIVNFNFAPEGLSVPVDHRSTKLVEDHPGGLVSADSELALEQQGRETSFVRRHQVRSPEPCGEWGLGVVKNGRSCQRHLVAAGGALPPTVGDQWVRTLLLAPGTRESLRPSARGEVVRARAVRGEVSLKLPEARGEGRSRHPSTLLVVAC